MGRPALPPHPRLELWQRAHERGHAGALCDELVRSRPVPPRLLAALGLLDRKATP